MSTRPASTPEPDCGRWSLPESCRFLSPPVFWSESERPSRIRIRSAVRTARNELLVDARRVEHYQDVLLPLREQIIDETQLQYNAMELGVFQLIAARRDQVRTAQEYVVALREYWHARATMDQILAGRLVSAEGDFDMEMP